MGSKGENGVTVLSKQYDIPVLCRIPLESKVAADCEDGAPVVLSHPDSHTAASFMELATYLNNVLNVV